MKFILAAPIVAINVSTIANAASTIVTTRNGNTITTTIRDAGVDRTIQRVPGDVPPNKCDTPTSSAFEMVTGPDRGACIGKVAR